MNANNINLQGSIELSGDESICRPASKKAAVVITNGIKDGLSDKVFIEVIDRLFGEAGMEDNLILGGVLINLKTEFTNKITGVLDDVFPQEEIQTQVTNAICEIDFGDIADSITPAIRDTVQDYLSQGGEGVQGALSNITSFFGK